MFCCTLELKSFKLVKGYDSTNAHKSSLCRRNFNKCTSTNIPMDLGLKLQKEMGVCIIDATLYQYMVGSLHSIFNTWFDIGYVLSVTNRCAFERNKAYLKIVKHIMWYMHITQSYALFYPKRQHIFHDQNILFTFTNVNYGHDLKTRISTTWIFHKLGVAPINWSNKLQPIDFLLITKMKYQALSQTTKDIVNLQWLLTKLEIHNTQQHNY
jgi:hypothetical protein